MDKTNALNVENINEIDKSINELVGKKINLQVAERLSILYTAKKAILENISTPQIMVENKEVVKEYKDILPRYNEYCTIKKQVQLNQLPTSALEQATDYLCNEIYEFIDILFQNIDTQYEKEHFSAMTDKLRVL